MSATKLNPDFIQFANPGGLRAMQVLTRKNANAAALFYFMCEHMDKSNCLIASRTVLASRMCWSRSTVARAVRFLKQNKYVAVFKSGSSNVYCLNADIVWKTHADKRADAMLQGKVLLSLDEQDDDVQIKAKKSMHQLELIKS